MTSFDIVESNVDLPDLNTVVRLYGNSARRDVAGAGCLAIVIGTLVGG